MHRGNNIFVHISMYVHAGVCDLQCFALLLMPPLILKVEKRVRPDLPKPDYVKRASLTGMPTWKYQSKGLV